MISGVGSEDPLSSDALSSEVYRNLLETVSDAIVSVDARQVIVLFNAQAERIFGYSSQEVLGQPLALLLPEVFRDTHTAHVQNVGSEQVTRHQMGEALDLLARRKCGETFPVKVSISGLRHGDAMLFTAVVRDMTARRRAERLLQSVVDVTSMSVGDELFRNLVRSLAESSGVTTAYISLVVGAGQDRMRTVAFWHDGRFADNFEYSLHETPCAAVLSTGSFHGSHGVQAKFPGDTWLRTEQIDGYLGLVLRDSEERPIGVIAFMDRRPLMVTAGVDATLRIFAARARMELERQRNDAALRTSEERFRAQYKSSPLAIYTWRHEENEFRLLDCNDAAERATEGRVAELMGAGLGEFFGDSPAVVADMWRCFRERTVVKREIDHVFRTTGHRAWLAVTMAYVPPNLVMVYTEDITASRQAQEEVRQLNADLEARVRDRTSELQASQARLAEAQQVAHVGSWEYDPGAGLLLRSAETCRILGLSPEAGDGFSPLLFERVHPDDRNRLASTIRSAIDTRESASLECRVRRPDGAERVLHLRARAVIDPPGSPIRLVGTLQDVTEQRATEQELLRRGEMLRLSQKMEAVGMLAGGVAHDFNNLLTIIRGHAESLIGRLPARDAGQRRTKAILFAVDRAAAMTAQLLAFGRKQPHQPKPIDLDEAVGAIEDMLARLGGRRNKLVRFAEPGLRRIWADRGQIEQILLNLVANARDAMPHGGPITIETDNVRVDEPLAERLGAPQGEYVRLVVRDKGVGMDAEVQSHIFEPFFTTKAIGKGTGLGLSTVYGIVQQSGGYIALDSAPGQGTTFAIYFPQLASSAEEDEAMAEHTRPDEVRGGGETILLVEDEDGVRELIAEFLESRGYHVLTGSDGAMALCKAAEYAGPIHLLLTDVVMPVMNGPELVDRMRRERPETRVLFMSGYTPEPTLLGGARFSEVVLIRKPFALDALAHTIRDTLDLTR